MPLTIYIDNKPLVLATQAEALLLETHNFTLCAAYTGEVAQLQHYAQLLSANKRSMIQHIIVTCENPLTAFEQFRGRYSFIEAAGGAVCDAGGRVLMIYRRGSWDLPKGKLEIGETLAQAAVREVEEETGLVAPELASFLVTTYHIYTHKSIDVIKASHWFLMHADSTAAIAVQTEEDIEGYEWITPAAALVRTEPTYPSVLDVLRILVSGSVGG